MYSRLIWGFYDEGSTRKDSSEIESNEISNDSYNESSVVEITGTILVKDALPVALQCGIKFEDFWNLSIVDIKTICESYNEKYRNEKKWEAMMCYNNAYLVRSAVASCFDKNNKFPKIHEMFPQLFEQEEHEVQKVFDENGELVQINVVQQDPEIFKERILEFAEVNNRKYQKADN